MNEIFQQFSTFLQPIIRKEVTEALQEFKNQIEKPKDERLYSRQETAQKLKVSLVTLNKWVNENRITAHRIGIRVLFKAEDIDKCLSKIKAKNEFYSH